MSEQWLECVVCHARFEVAPMFFGCPKCASRGDKAAVEMQYDYGRADLSKPDAQASGIWRWRTLLPKVKPEAMVSLEEGGTPLVKVRDWPGPSRLYLKNETVNPTWSYKDRANCLSVAMAVEFGYENVVAVSTGNHGNAAAAYSAAAGRRCVVFCHADAPELQLSLMRFYGAKAFRGGRQDAMAKQLVDRGGWFPSAILCPRVGFANPYGVEGFKTMAFEIFHQLGGKVPDRVFVPVGSGDGLYGVWKGFLELQRTGLADRTPRMYASQASGANPYVRAFRSREPHLTEVASADTVALSIAERIGSELALRAIYDSSGAALEVDDPTILATAAALARQGLAVEPASAASVACARSMAGSTEAEETWIAIGTGAAVKWPHSLPSLQSAPEKLPPDFEEVDRLL